MCKSAAGLAAKMRVPAAARRSGEKGCPLPPFFPPRAALNIARPPARQNDDFDGFCHGKVLLPGCARHPPSPTAAARTHHARGRARPHLVSTMFSSPRLGLYLRSETCERAELIAARPNVLRTSPAAIPASTEPSDLAASQ